MVIDLKNAKLKTGDFDFKSFGKVLKKNKLLPVGIRGCSPQQLTCAREAGFATMLETDPNKSFLGHIDDGKNPANSSPSASNNHQTLLITKPIRSGQQIYAQSADLVIVSSVSPGAELLADGNIHVYGTLKGRALAGVNGNTRARIFCKQLKAELISIAGQYKIFEDLQTHDTSNPKQIYLDDGQLVISSL